MLAVTVSCADVSLGSGEPCPLPPVELCVAHPAAIELWHLAVNAASPQALAVVCVSGAAAHDAVIASPSSFATIVRCGAVGSRCPDAEACPVARRAATRSSTATTTSPPTFLYTYHGAQTSHEAAAVVATATMVTLRRHLLRLLGLLDLQEHASDEDNHSERSRPLAAVQHCVPPSCPHWCPPDVLETAGRHVLVEPTDQNAGGDTILRVCWAAPLVAAMARSWQLYVGVVGEAAQANNAVITDLLAATVQPWLRHACERAAVHTLLVRNITSAVTQEPMRNASPPAMVARVDEAIEAWSEDDGASISDLDCASETSASHRGSCMEESHSAHDEAPSTTPVAGRTVERTCVLTMDPRAAMIIHDVPPRSTLLLARSLSATAVEPPLRHPTLILAVSCVALQRIAESPEDAWLALRVAGHLLERVLLPADRHREDGNDLLADSQPGATTEAANIYLAGARLAQEGLSYPYRGSWTAARHAGGYLSADPLDATSPDVTACCAASREAVYSHTAGLDAGLTLFLKQRVWKPMVVAEAAGVFANVLLRVCHLPSHAAVVPALAYLTPAAATRAAAAGELHPCLGPALGALTWRRHADGVGRYAPVTQLQLIWYTLHRVAVVLAANTAEATLRAVAERTEPTSITLADLDARARACEKASGILWGLLQWHQPAGPAPCDEGAWGTPRSAEAQTELLWCFQMFSKLQLRAARLFAHLGDREGQKNAVWQLREAHRRWANARTRREAEAAAAAEVLPQSWKTVPENTPESLVCELSVAQWSAVVADAERALAQL